MLQFVFPSLSNVPDEHLHRKVSQTVLFPPAGGGMIFRYYNQDTDHTIKWI